MPENCPPLGVCCQPGMGVHHDSSMMCPLRQVTTWAHCVGKEMRGEMRKESTRVRRVRVGVGVGVMGVEGHGMRRGCLTKEGRSRNSVGRQRCRGGEVSGWRTGFGRWRHSVCLGLAWRGRIFFSRGRRRLRLLLNEQLLFGRRGRDPVGRRRGEWGTCAGWVHVHFLPSGSKGGRVDVDCVRGLAHHDLRGCPDHKHAPGSGSSRGALSDQLLRGNNGSWMRWC
mmetsp:Transcript_15918/g.21990  ORF Transcript_15918/g.21990 Transcript_15918/m.21990 type:complete len:225 (-) Transcript_15918:194-868(-)